MAFQSCLHMLSLRVLYLMTLCLFAFSGQVFAQDYHQPGFKHQVNQFFSTGSFYRSTDHATIWGAAGSSWALEGNGSAPEAIAKYLDRFHWRGSKIEFNTKFCSLDSERPRPLTLKGHIDFSQSNRYSGTVMPQRVIMSTSQGAASAELKGKCILISEISDILDGRVMFKADMRYDDRVKIDIYDSYNNGSNAGSLYSLVYKPDNRFEPLSRTAWKIRPDNGAPKCGALWISARGEGYVNCCNYLGFGVEKVDEGWRPDGRGYEQTLRGCHGDLGRADSEMQRALSTGLTINADGNLVAGEQSETPYIFDPVTTLDKAQGDWTLTGLEYRSFDSRIFTLPNVFRVSDQDALRKSDVKLTVRPMQLNMKAGCNSIQVNIAQIKPDYLRMDDQKKSRSDYCNIDEVISGVQTVKLSSIIGGPIIKVDHDEHAQTLTLTRASIGAFGRSHSWIFSR